MQVIFESRDPEVGQLHTLAVRQVRVAMRRLTWLVPRVRVHMSDVNGPRGGIDKRCQVELMTDSAGSVIITSMARNWRCALQSALARAARALLHNLQRVRNKQRAGPPTLALDS